MAEPGCYPDLLPDEGDQRAVLLGIGWVVEIVEGRRGPVERWHRSRWTDAQRDRFAGRGLWQSAAWLAVQLAVGAQLVRCFTRDPLPVRPAAADGSAVVGP